MGKAGRIKVTKRTRNVPLAEQIEDRFELRAPRNRMRNDQDETLVDDKLSRKILDQARRQQEDLEEEYGSKSGGEKPVQLMPDESSSEDEATNDDDDYYESIEVDEADEKAMELFMNENTRRTLSDIIMEKLRETRLSEPAGAKLDPRVEEMYRGVKQVLSKYRSGKLPKAFKIVPALSNWEQVLYLTDPDSWTSAAMYQATRIFTSNLKEKMAQRFFNMVLLPRVRDDIGEYKKLNYHLYQALRKALFKPGAFFKGLLLPLCQSRTCTLREAIIISSVLGKHSVPVLHACAGMLKIAEMEYTGANSIFLRVLLDKKYTLPYRVVDAIVYHFLRFEHEKRELPVLWHQCLLTFAQRYKDDISSEQKELLLRLLRVQSHPKVTPEIRQELELSKCRDSQ